MAAPAAGPAPAGRLSAHLAYSFAQCSIMEYREYRIVYRRYASLFFIVGIDRSDEVRCAVPPSLRLRGRGVAGAQLRGVAAGRMRCRAVRRVAC